MTPVNVQRKGWKQPRALQISEVSTAEFIDVAYEFGFEWFGPDRGTQRLVHRTDDSLEDYLDDRFDELAAQTGGDVEWYLYDAYQCEWVIVNPGDWVVEARINDCDGFIRYTDEQFHERWDVLDA